MSKSTTHERTKHLSGFAPAAGSKLPFSSDIFDAEARAREKLLGAQRAFVSKSKRSAKDVDNLVDQMISFEKIRSCHYWREDRAAALARDVRQAVGKTGAKLDFSKLLRKAPNCTVALPRLDIPDFDLVPFEIERGEGQTIDLAKVNHGTYFDKWFDYTGPWTLTQLYDLARTAPVPFSMDFVSAHNFNPYGEDGLRATSETGIWFSYTPDIDGYLTVLWSTRANHRLFREYYPRDADGWANAHLSVEAVVGLWTEHGFVGRDYIQLSGGFDGTASDVRDTGSYLLLHNSTYPVKAGKQVGVLLGTRSKMLAIADGSGINAGAGIFAPVEAIGMFTRADPEPYSPFAP